MAGGGSDLLLRIDVPQGRRAAFEAFAEELVAVLSRDGIHLPGAPGQPVLQEGREIGRVAAWEAGFAEARVERPDLETYARLAGLREDIVRQFRGPSGCQLLTARKAEDGTTAPPFRGARGAG